MLSPNSGEQNTTFGVTVTGSGTTWSSSHCVEFDAGVSTFSFVASALGASSLSGTLSVPASANVSSNYDVRVYNFSNGSCFGLSDGTCTNCFSVTAPVPIVSISPTSSQQGTSTAVIITGTNTTWTNGTTHCVELSDGTSTFSFTGTANAFQQLSGTLNVPLNANVSSGYDVTVYDVNGGSCSGVSDGTCTNCFTVSASAGILLSPTSGEQNSSFGVTVTGTGTTWSSAHCVEFSDGVSTFSFTGTALAASTLTGTLNIPAGANVSSNYDVTVYNDNLGNCSGINDGLCQNCFSVTVAIPVVSFVNPNSIQQCDAFSVTISGTNTTWASGTTHCVEFSDGVSTFSFTGTANSSQQLTGTLEVPANANPSSNYDITVYDVDGGSCSGVSDGTCTNCFTVQAAPTIMLSPTSGEQNSSFGVTVTGMGSTWSSAHCVEFSDGVSTFNFTGTAITASTLTGTLNIPAGANVSSNYDVKVYNDNMGNCSGVNDGICENCFSVTAAIPVVSFVNPNSIQQCDAFSVTISGTNTTWASGTTHCVEFSDGTSTFSFTGTANSSQQLTGTLEVPADANPSSNYDITVYDVDGGSCSGVSDGTCTNCFTVLAAPTIMVFPTSGEQNTSFSVTITGMGSTWSSAHCVEFSDGVSTFNFTGMSFNASTLTGTLSIPIGANVSSNYDVKVYDNNVGSCVGVNDGICQDCFTVTATTPSISFISPSSLAQGDDFPVIVSGTNTTWANGTTHCIEFDDGVSNFSFVGTANGSQQLLGNLVVPPTANVSSNYNVTVFDVDGGACSGVSDGVCASCFNVTEAPPINSSPLNGGIGETFAISITGTGTNWSSAHCVEFSDGVSTFTFVGMAMNASTITGNLTVPMSANISANYDIKVYVDPTGNCSGLGDGLCVDCFEVTSAVPVEWLSFRAALADEGVQLDWSTATELNSHYFEVQRSWNAKDWQALHHVDAQGFSTAVSDYGYLDRNPYPGLNYYRIEQVDVDGQKSYTPVKSVVYEASKRLFEVFPNPTADEVNIFFNDEQAGTASLLVQDIFGQTVLQELDWDAGANPKVSLATLPAGVYFIRIQRGSQQDVRQIVKQ